MALSSAVVGLILVVVSASLEVEVTPSRSGLGRTKPPHDSGLRTLYARLHRLSPYADLEALESS